MKKTSPPTSESRAFTLVELLAVVTIIIVLLALITPSVTRVLESANLTTGANMVVDQISLARQTASAKNRDVEIRFIKSTDNSKKGYYAVQLFAPDANGQMNPAGRIVNLPTGIGISENAGLSALFSTALTTSGTMPSGNDQGAAYSAFDIRPSGEVEPVPAKGSRSSLYLTVVRDRYASQDAPPPNYLTIQINPDTGSVQFYQP